METIMRKPNMQGWLRAPLNVNTATMPLTKLQSCFPNLFSKCLSFHGLLNRTKKTKLNLRDKIFLVVVNVYAVHFAASSILKTYRYGNLYIHLTTSFYVFKILYTAFCVNKTFYDGYLVSACLKICPVANASLGVKCYQIGFLLVGASNMIQALYVIPQNETFVRLSISRDFYNIEYLKSHYILGYILLLLHVAMLYYFRHIIGFMYQAVAFSSVESLRHRMTSLADRMTDCKYGAREICRQHTELFATTSDLNAALKFNLLFWVVDWTGNFYYFLMVLNYIKRIPKINLIYQLSPVLSLFLLLFSMTLISDSKWIWLRALHLRSVKTRRFASREKLALNAYLHKNIQTGIVQFNLLKSAVFDKNFLSALVVAVLSYITFVWSLGDSK